MAIKKTETPKKVEKAKEIVLMSSNPNLSIFPLKVQFIKGRFVTTDRKLADIVLNYDGVFEL